MVIAYSYGLGSNGTTILELCGVVEKLKVNDIVFWFECIWDEMAWELWAYKGVEVKMVNENVKSFVCVR